MTTSRILLIGPAGAGKTHRLLKEFETSLKTDPSPLSENSFFLVPSAEHTGRLITVLMARGIEGFFYRRVTTLSRLVSSTFGIGDEGTATNMTRYVLLREIFEKENWDCFREIQKSTGFLNHMLSFISELKESMISAELWRQKMNEMKRLEPDLASKYEALAGIYEAYEGGLQKKGLRDRQDGFRIFQERKRTGAFKGRRFRALWLDGFFDFSALQLAYFRELCEMSDQVTVTLTMTGDPARAELFEGLRPVYETLKQMNFRIEKLNPATQPRFSSSGLAHIEKNLFREEKSPAVLRESDKKDQSLVVFDAIGIEGEVEMIARQIEKLYRSGEYRFSDFAILLREIGAYDGVIRSVFSRYDIPVEVHERERLSFAPVIRVLVRLLKIFREGWKRSDLIEFLKSTYVVSLGDEARDYEWVSTLEHKAMETGVFRGREAWLRPWAESGADDFDKARERRLGVISLLEDALRSASSFPEFRAILIRAAAKTFGIFQRTNSQEEYARRDAAAWRRFESILDEIGMSFTKDEAVSLDAFADRFFRLVELDLYPLHEQDRNRVQVYSVSLARQKEYRVVFVAGLLEKKFPVQIKEDPVLSDWERRLFNGLGKKENSGEFQEELKERLPRQAMERYLFYVAVTRASEKLFLTYPRLDLEGKESLPSYYIEEVLAHCPDPSRVIRKQSLGRPYPELEEAVNERELEMAVMGELWRPENSGENRSLVLVLTNELLRRSASREKFKRAFYEVQDKLSDPVLAGLEIFRPYETSATTLEEYARCPFKYYARKVLRLDDPEEDVNITRRGIILHRVLQKCFEKWGAKIPGFIPASKDALKELESAFREFPLVTEKRYQLDLERISLTEMLMEFLESELERLKDSPLQPRYFELDFGRGTSGLPALEIKTADGKIIRIRGQIDRVDTDASGTIGEVLDYKRTAGSAKFDKEDFETGISLQLPLYLNAIEKFLKLQPAGAELYAVRERKKSGFYHADYTHLFPGLSPRKTILQESEFRHFLDRSLEFSREFSAAMARMEMPVRPRSATECDYCSCGPVCRIQKWQVPMIVEEIKESMNPAKEKAGLS